MEPSNKKNKKILWPEEIAAKLFEEYQIMLNSKLYGKDMEMVEVLAENPLYKGIYTLDQIKSKIKNQKHAIAMKNLQSQKSSLSSIEDISSPPSTPTNPNGVMITRRQRGDRGDRNSISKSNDSSINNISNINGGGSVGDNSSEEDEDLEEEDLTFIERQTTKPQPQPKQPFTIQQVPPPPTPPTPQPQIQQQQQQTEELIEDTRSYKKVRLSNLSSIPNVSTPPAPPKPNEQQQLLIVQENKLLKQSNDQLEFQLKYEKEQNSKLKKLVTKLNEDLQQEKQILNHEINGTIPPIKKLTNLINSNFNFPQARSISTNSVIFKKDNLDNSIIAIFPTFNNNLPSNRITLSIEPNPPEGYYKIIIENNIDHSIQTYLIKRFDTHHDPEPCLIGTNNSKAIYFKSKDLNVFKISLDNLKDFEL